jgi:hypothetical protein
MNRPDYYPTQDIMKILRTTPAQIAKRGEEEQNRIISIQDAFKNYQTNTLKIVSTKYYTRDCYECRRPMIGKETIFYNKTSIINEQCDYCEDYHFYSYDKKGKQI